MLERRLADTLSMGTGQTLELIRMRDELILAKQNKDKERFEEIRKDLTH